MILMYILCKNILKIFGHPGNSKQISQTDHCHGNARMEIMKQHNFSTV